MPNPQARKIYAGAAVASLLSLALAAAPVVAQPGLSSVASAAPALAVRPTVGSSPGGAYAILKTIEVGRYPIGIAVDSVDDTVYVVNYFDNSLSAVNGNTGTVDNTVTVGSGPIFVAVNEADDSVYVTNVSGQNLSLVSPRAGYATIMLPISGQPYGIAVDQIDDTVYVSRYSSGSVAAINGRQTDDSTTFVVGNNPVGIAVDDVDDTVYVANYSGASVTIVNGRDYDDSSTLGSGFPSPWALALNQADDTLYASNALSTGSVSVLDTRTRVVAGNIAVGSSPLGIGVFQQDGTIYVGNLDSDSVSVIDPATGTVASTILVGDGPEDLAVDDSGTNAGLVYVTIGGGGSGAAGTNSVAVIGHVVPSLITTSGAAGDTVVISVDAPQVDYDIDDSSVASVSFGGVSAQDLSAGVGDTWTVTAPAGSGTVPVTVNFDGGQSASAGSFTFPPVACASSSFTSDDSCSVASGETVNFVVVGGRGGAGGAGGSGGDGGSGYQCSPANGGLGGSGGSGGSGGAALQVSGSYTNSTSSAVTLDVLVGADGADGSTGPDGMPGSDGTLGTPGGTDGSDAADGTDGQDGTASGIAIHGGPTVVTVGEGTGGTKGTGGIGGGGGSGSPACTSGSNGNAGTDGTPGVSGTLVAPATLPSGWSATMAAGSPRVLFTSPTPTPTPPTPAFPPSAPLSVSGTAGDASAEISWLAPESSGSFPVAYYQATVSPGGKACLVTTPSLSCSITGLVNGETYSVRVRALNGAGWGPYSASSEPFTPEAAFTASIMISGSRGEVRGKPGIIVEGRTTGFGQGAILRPWVRFPGQTSYSEGVASILVAEDGEFTWQRRTGKKTYVSVRSADESVASNRIVIAAR